jgi:two-component system LytT family response regulator
VPFVEQPNNHCKPYLGRITLRDGRRTLSIVLDDVEWIEAAGNYLHIHMDRKSHLVRHTVKGMAAKLDPRCFVRVRPSAILNVRRIRAVLARPGGDYTFVLKDGTQIRSSRLFREDVERVFGSRPRRRSPPSPAPIPRFPISAGGQSELSRTGIGSASQKLAQATERVIS